MEHSITLRKCPALTPELIEYLQYMYPEKSYQHGESHNDAVRRGGQCDVVAHLKVQLKEQEKVKYRKP